MAPVDPGDDAEDAGAQDFDPGLARERTELAWTRTTISFAALGGALLRNFPAAGLVVLVSSIAIWELGRLPRAPGNRLGAARLRLITAIITAAALATLGLSFLRW